VNLSWAITPLGIHGGIIPVMSKRTGG
jgi:hypothetical protein